MNTVRILPKLLLLGTTLVLVVSLGCTSGGPNGMHGQTRVTPPSTERRPVYVQRSSTMGEGVVPSSPTRFESDSTSRAAAGTAQTSSQAYRTGGWTPVTPEEKGTSVASQPGTIEHTAHYPDMSALDDDSSVEDLDSLEPFDKPKTPRADATAPSAPAVAPIPAETSQPVPQRTLHWMPTSASSEAVHAAAVTTSSSSTASGSHFSVSPEEVPLKRTFFTHLFSNVSMKPEDPAFELEAPAISVKRPVSKDEEELERAKAQIASHFTDEPETAVATGQPRTNGKLSATSAVSVTTDGATQGTASAKGQKTPSGWRVLTPAEPNPAYGSSVNPSAAPATAAPTSAATPSESVSSSAPETPASDADDPGIVDLDTLPKAQ